MFKTHGQFEKLLEKATSNYSLEVDWESTMQICDLIRQKDCPPKYAATAIKKKLYSPNPHTVTFALQVLESVVKNCGSPIHDEVITKTFMEELRDLAKKNNDHEKVHTKILELVQTWGHAFRNSPKYRAAQDIFNIMKTEGEKFPPLVEADAMFSADTAPEWADGQCCNRCRTDFTIVNRKHHCRACGQIFCSKCSSKACPIPKFGIEKEVRVCESCFEKYKPQTKSAYSSGHHSNHKSSDEDHMLHQALAASLADAKAEKSNKGSKTEEELQEEEQLQLAIAISQSEAEAKEREKRKTGSYRPQAPDVSGLDIPEKDLDATETPQIPDPDHIWAEDPELARYMNRSYWEKRPLKGNLMNGSASQDTDDYSKAKVEVSQNSPNKTNALLYNAPMPSAPVNEPKDKAEQDEEVNNFILSLRSQLTTFVNRMKSNSSRGRPICYDSTVQSLFTQITQLHPQLLNYIEDQDKARLHFEGLQDKLNQLRDARAALDSLREEHRERLRQQAEEQERIRQLQMSQKLHFMRQKKQEFLQYQRQIALQRMQEQEREMQMRIVNQKQGYQMGAAPNPGYHPNFMPPQFIPGGAPPMQGPPNMPYMNSPPPPGPGPNQINQFGMPKPQEMPPGNVPVMNSHPVAGIPNQTVVGAPNPSGMPMPGVANPQVGGIPNPQVAGIHNPQVPGVSNPQAAGVPNTSVPGVAPYASPPPHHVTMNGGQVHQQSQPHQGIQEAPSGNYGSPNPPVPAGVTPNQMHSMYNAPGSVPNPTPESGAPIPQPNPEPEPTAELISFD